MCLIYLFFPSDYNTGRDSSEIKLGRNYKAKLRKPNAKVWENFR